MALMWETLFKPLKKVSLKPGADSVSVVACAKSWFAPEQTSSLSAGERYISPRISSSVDARGLNVEFQRL